MSYVYDTDVPIVMRDGITLAANVFRPATGQVPTLLMRTPYGKDGNTGAMSGGGKESTPSIFVLVEAGYAVICQDVRGTGHSEGEFYPHTAERSDGVDTVEWIKAQPWSNGVIGMYGASYQGMVQWEIATTGIEGVKAIAPEFSSIDNYEAPWFTPGGAPVLSLWTMWNLWMYTLRALRDQRLGKPGAEEELLQLAAASEDPNALNEFVPTGHLPALKGKGWWDDWIAHPSHDAYWDAISLRSDVGNVTVPALHIAGWFDLYIHQSISAYLAAKNGAATAEARNEQRLVIGPWDHVDYSGEYAGRAFGPMASLGAVELDQYHLRFFDRWLRGNTAALDNDAPVKLFIMGSNEWRDEQDFPLPSTQYVDYFLSSAEGANSSAGDGQLTTSQPQASGSDAFRYDPSDPVRTAGGPVYAATRESVGPVDQRHVEARADVLSFTSPPLDAPLEVIGFVRLHAFVSSSAIDTDFAVKLVDVYPDGQAINLCDDILRMRYRNGAHEQELMTPGDIYEVDIDLAVTANLFQAGHRIRVDIAGSNFPRFDRNSNTGSTISEDGEADFVVATNVVYHGPEHPTRLVLPVIPRQLN